MEDLEKLWSQEIPFLEEDSTQHKKEFKNRKPTEDGPNSLVKKKFIGLEKLKINKILKLIKNIQQTIKISAN